MHLDIVRAVRKTGCAPLHVDLEPGLYTWLVPDLDAANGWAHLLAGLAQPIRGEIRLVDKQGAVDPFRSADARKKIGSVHLDESGELLGATAEAHLKSVAQIRSDKNLLERINLPPAFLQRKTDSLSADEIRLLHLELALATLTPTQVIIVEPHVYPYARWGQRIQELLDAGSFVHLLTISEERAQLLGGNLLYVERPARPFSRKHLSLRAEVRDLASCLLALDSLELEVDRISYLPRSFQMQNLDWQDVVAVQNLLLEHQVQVLDFEVLTRTPTNAQGYQLGLDQVQSEAGELAEDAE